MPIDPETVRKTALLARLELTSDELARYQDQLGAIVDYVGQLAELDITNVEPLAHAGDAVNVFRDDLPRPSLSSETALKNAPQSAGPYFVVPKVVE
jgi:aspartyl-tRNA(Asn)/glutamyl-tRNA(Gln) amidotransferase subunit C